jgi:hypothetical protein
MSPTAVVGWVLTVTPALRLSQRKTLADLVEAATRVGRGTLSALGRCLRGTAAKHAITRVWRFCGSGGRCCWWPSTGPTCGGSTP